MTGVEGGNRTRTPLRTQDFLTNYDFHRQLSQKLFVVWTLSSSFTIFQ